MSAVLFIVTIPTKAEEDRLKDEFFAKKFDYNPENHVDTEKVLTPTITTTTESTPTQPTQESETNNDFNLTKKRKSTTFQLPDEVMAVYGSGTPQTPRITTFTEGQFDTFPKRRKSQTSATSTVTMPSMAVKTPPVEAPISYSESSNSGSLRDVDADMAEAPGTTRKSWEGIRDILSSAKRKTHKRKETPPHIDLNIPNDTCMEVVLHEILRKFQISTAVWTKDQTERTYQVVFTVEFDETYEKLLEKLNEWGIGDREGSTVSAVSCVASKIFNQKENIEDDDDQLKKDNLITQKQGAWDRFMNTVRSRLNVTQIVRDVRQDAAISFDFVVLLVSAAILASFGLAEDSTIFLASSMLISPLMGPIIAGIFGTVIRDPSLRSLGLKNELLGLLIATVVGFLFGLILALLDERYVSGEGLTAEMMSRCEMHSLLVGVFTAVASGAAAAIGILGGNIGSLVGVAISASLLPPAVNSGLLWALACIYKLFERDDAHYNHMVKTRIYSNNQATELAVMGLLSMCVTISNIICIYVMGILVLKVKEIAPVISRQNSQFWKHDIKIARDLNRNGFDADAAIIDEFANLPKEDQKVLGIGRNIFRNIHMDDRAYQHTWSPITSRHRFDATNFEPFSENYLTVHRIEQMYSTITKQQQNANERRLRFSFSRYPMGGRFSEVGNSYAILDENLPRCATMPAKASRPNIGIVPASPLIEADVATCSTTSASIGTTGGSTDADTNGDKKRQRKFIVTPAAEDPLLKNNETGTIRFDV